MKGRHQEVLLTGFEGPRGVFGAILPKVLASGSQTSSLLPDSQGGLLCQLSATDSHIKCSSRRKHFPEEFRADGFLMKATNC